MKKLLVIFCMIPLIGLSQTAGTIGMGKFHIYEEVEQRKDLWQEWAEYVKDCNKLVADTITEQEKVSVKYVPVLLNGEVTHLKLAPIDTAWTKQECNDYKHSREYGLTLTSGHSLYYINNSITQTGLNSSVFYSKPEQSLQYINITRNKICHIKKRKATWEDFWDRWLVEKAIIKTN